MHIPWRIHVEEREQLPGVCLLYHGLGPGNEAQVTSASLPAEPFHWPQFLIFLWFLGYRHIVYIPSVMCMMPKQPKIIHLKHICPVRMFTSSVDF